MSILLLSLPKFILALFFEAGCKSDHLSILILNLIAIAYLLFDFSFFYKLLLQLFMVELLLHRLSVGAVFHL